LVCYELKFDLISLPNFIVKQIWYLKWECMCTRMVSLLDKNMLYFLNMHHVVRSYYMYCYHFNDNIETMQLIEFSPWYSSRHEENRQECISQRIGFPLGSHAEQVAYSSQSRRSVKFKSSRSRWIGNVDKEEFQRALFLNFLPLANLMDWKIRILLKKNQVMNIITTTFLLF